MQSMPTYYTTTYPPPSPYPTSSLPGTGSTVMTISNPPRALLSNAIGAIEQQTLLAANANAVATKLDNQSKRNQVKNACTNCQKACKKCDDARPCPRCVKYGIADTCVNSVRKERKKGIKRGPYKRRQKSNDDSTTTSSQPEQPHYNLRAGENAANGTDNATATGGTDPADYGYPSNLTQYTNQAYDPYHYAATANQVYTSVKSESVVGVNGQNEHVYIVNPVYPSYPNNEEDANHATTGGENNNTTAAYLNAILHQTTGNTNSAAGISVLNSGPPPPLGVYYQSRPDSSFSTTDSASGATKEQKQDGIKQQPMTPVPSTSNSSGTTSPSETNITQDDDESSKFARLTQLCSAALRETQEKADAKAAANAANQKQNSVKKESE